MSFIYSFPRVENVIISLAVDQLTNARQNYFNIRQPTEMHYVHIYGVFHRAVNATFEQVPIPLFVVNNVHIG